MKCVCVRCSRLLIPDNEDIIAILMKKNGKERFTKVMEFASKIKKLQAISLILAAAAIAPSPATPVAAVGSFVAAILLVVSHELFSAFATRGAITSIYGSLALLPLFLMWLWLMWLIILFGLELTYTLQSLKGKISMEEQAIRNNFAFT